MEEFAFPPEGWAYAWILVIYVIPVWGHERGSIRVLSGGGMDEWRHGGTWVRCSVRAIAGIAALALVLSGCGQQGTGQSSYSPRSVIPPSASQTQGVTSSARGSSETGSFPTAPGSGGHRDRSPSLPGKASAGARTTTPGPGPGSSAQGPGSSAQGSGTGNDCPTAGVGGDPVPPPCPVAAASTTSDGIQGPVTASPTSSRGGQGTCPTAAPSPAVAVNTAVTPAATECPSP
jgi:hypothetical protein